MTFYMGCIVGCGIGGMAILVIVLWVMAASTRKGHKYQEESMEILRHGNRLREERNEYLRQIAENLYRARVGK